MFLILEVKVAADRVGNAKVEIEADEMPAARRDGASFV